MANELLCVKCFESGNSVTSDYCENDINLCAGHVTRSSRPYERLLGGQRCQAYVNPNGQAQDRRLCRKNATLKVAGDNGLRFCKQHVLCRGFATSTSLPCRSKGMRLDKIFFCHHHAGTDAFATPVRHPNPVTTPALPTVAPASVLTEERLAMMEAMMSRMGEQLNELTLMARSSPGSPSGPFSSPHNH